jgi:hypothetical protein
VKPDGNGGNQKRKRNEEKTMKIKTNLKAGEGKPIGGTNHNQSGLAVKTN